ncbi:hypothetical protein C7N43_29360, partial [Sphingobacteriales bacterium UPWRP_1]
MIQHITPRYVLTLVVQFSAMMLFIFVQPRKVYAQSEMCSTGSNYPNALTVVGSPPCNEPITNPYYLRIAVNLMRRSDGSCDRTLQDVYEALDLMQEPFAAHNIYFRLACIQFLDDDDLYNQTDNEAQYCIAGLPYPNSCTYLNFPDLFFNDAITIFVYPKGEAAAFGGGFGWASGIPGNGLMVKGFWRSTEIDNNGNTISEQFVDVFKSGILAHEMGHCLGLFHTFHGLCGEDGCVETTEPEVYPDNPCLCGDYVADTPADPGIGDGVIDDETCELITLLGCLETMPPGYNPLTDNVMSYVGPTCEQNLTNGQKDRVKQHLLNAPLYAPVLQNCIIPLSEVNQTLAQNWFSEQTLAAGITEWSFENIHILGKITVPAGATLHINNALVEFEDETSGIVVQKGGVLIAENNTILRGNSCNQTIWSGILIEGNAFEPIPASAYSDGMFFEHHGIARFKSNVVIEGAKAGIQAGDFIDGSLPPTDANNTYGGGALFIEQTHFINNSVGAYLLPQFKGDNLFTRLSDCTVTFSAAFGSTHMFENIGYTGIYAIRPYVVQGCTFQNAAASFAVNERGTGIISNIYGGWVIPSLNGTPCYFSNLYKGIDAYSLGSLQSGLFVAQNVFDEVSKSITLNGNTASLISQNQFLRLNKNSYAIYALGTRGLSIYNNTITVSVLPDDYNEKPFGIALQNSGIGGALVLKNTFQPHNAAQAAVQRFRAAVQVEGNNNPNVQIDCNTFSAFSDFDLRIFDSPDFQDQGGCIAADDNINPTANNWHNPATIAGTYHIYYANATESFNVTYQPGYEPTLVSGNVETFDCNDDYNDCNSFIFEGGEIAVRIAYLQNRMYQSATQQEYERFYAELMRTYLQNSMLTQAKAETELRNDTEGNKILIATYTDERELEKADSLLQTLSQETPEDVDFYNFFNAYLYELWNNTDQMPFEGKALSPVAFQIQSMASNNNATSHISLFAQAAVATKQNNQYHRTPVDFKTNPTADIVTKDVLQVAPNPAPNEALISLRTDDWQQISSLKVYSLTGKLLQTLPLNRQPVYKP